MLIYLGAFAVSVGIAAYGEHLRTKKNNEKGFYLCLALAVEAIAVGQIEVGDAVAADDQKILLPQKVPTSSHPACGAQRGVLVEVVQAHPPGAAVAEVAGDGLRAVVEGHSRLGDLVAAQQQ